jgi:hypothetical protein
VLSALIVAGCGRLDFAEVRDAPPVVPFACPANTTSTVAITGRTFRYTNFTNQVAALDGVTVEALDRDGAVAAMTTSDGAGNYTLTFAPGDVHFRYARATYEPSIVYSDMIVDRDLAAMAQPLFALGDGPLWQTGAINSVYGSAGVARDTTKGTLNIGLRDCDGNALEGVTVTLDPPPGASTYQADDGTPDPTLTATIGPFAHYIALNAAPGPTRVIAAKDGLRFGELTVDVTEQASTLAIVHGGL